MLDRFNRTINYMRISVTDRCNLRCSYCMPPEGVPLGTHGDILSYEQITQVVKAAAELGITKVRLTGGEPLVRRDIEKLVAMISAVHGIEEVCMTTNGLRLPELAGRLKKAGLGRVNISLDSLAESKYAAITSGGDLHEALAGIEAALSAGLTPIKINMVVFEDTEKAEIEVMQRFCEQKGASLQLINRFSLECRRSGDGPVPADRPPACEDCNRLRMTADGHLKPCLFSEDEIPVDFDNIAASILAAVGQKPENGTRCRTRLMHAIGG